MQAGFLRRSGLALLLMLSSTTGFAKTTTINDITLDVPDDYKVSNSKRGVLVTSDGRRGGLYGSNSSAQPISPLSSTSI